MPSICTNPLVPVSSAHRTVSLLRASAFRKRRPFGSPIRLFMASDGWKFSWRGVPVSQHHQCHPVWSSVYSCFVPTSVVTYSIIPSVMGWQFCGVLSNYHFESREAGMSLMNSSSRDAFIAPNTCRPLVGSVPNEGVASSSVRFFLLYIQCSFLIFSLFHLCWLLRETERDHRLLLRGF